MTEDPTQTKVQSIPIISCLFSATAAVLGLIALVGWTLSIPWMTSFWTNGIPMAPSTSLLFLLYGSALLLRESAPGTSWRSRLSVLLAWWCTGFSLLLLISSWRGVYLPVEYLGMNISGMVQGAPIGHMSPMTASLFLISGCSLLCLKSRNRR